MKIKRILLISIFCFTTLFSCTSIVLAAPSLKDAVPNFIFAGEEAGYEQDDVFYIFSSIINTVISMLGIIFIALMIYGGYLWMTARGNEDQVEKSKKLITAAVIGLIIVLSAYAISYFVVSNIGDATLQQNP